MFPVIAVFSLIPLLQLNYFPSPLSIHLLLDIRPTATTIPTTSPRYLSTALSICICDIYSMNELGVIITVD